jgi:hypothetical protein
LDAIEARGALQVGTWEAKLFDSNGEQISAPDFLKRDKYEASTAE